MKKILLLVIVALSVFLVACSKGDLVLKEDFGLKSIRDDSELKEKLKPKREPISFFSWFFGATKGDVQLDEANDTVVPESPNQDRSYTGTNVQVKGVDEADIVKTDGNRIYSISYNYLQVIEVLGEGKMDVIFSKRIISDSVNKPYVDSFDDVVYRNTYYNGLYVTDKYLVAIGQQYSMTYLGKQESKSYSPYYFTNETVVYIYDIDTLEEKTSYIISGNLNDTRLIEDRLYAISSYTPRYDKEVDLRPYVGEDDTVDFVRYQDIKYLDDFEYQSFTIITTITLDDEPTMENDTFLGESSWGQVYVSHKGIYFSTYIYTSNWIGNAREKGMVVSYLFEEETGRVIYGGCATYDGSVLNQFAMDEYNGYFRLATSDGWGDSAKNRIYVFERQIVDGKYELVQVGLLDKGLGKPGERIKSVRFNEDLATVVTYVQTDPFYTVDLSNPKKPVIKGELVVSGYSAYQHPWGEGYVLGIGFEGEGNRMTGMKLSLYDIRDVENPVEVGKPYLFADNSYSYSEALYNHKALMVDVENGYFGFSVWLYNWNSNYSFNANEYIVFAVDPESDTPISKKHVVSHHELYDKSSYNYYSYYDFEIKRGIRIDDFLYVVSGEMISSHNLIGEFGLVEHIYLKEKSR